MERLVESLYLRIAICSDSEIMEMSLIFNYVGKL